jgi:hypothetical protein
LIFNFNSFGTGNNGFLELIFFFFLHSCGSLIITTLSFSGVS